MDFFESFLEGYPEVRSPDLPHALPSAFSAYKRPAMAGPNPNSQNLNKRVIEMLRRIQTAATNDRELEHDPGYRHMISERERRENLKEKFKILHSLLPRRSKNEKLSILTVAAQQLRELKRRKEELQRRNDEVSGSRVEREEETATVGIEVQYPTSPIDCVMAVAGCLKSRGLKATRMRVEVSHPELSVMVDVQAEDVKKAEEAIGDLLGGC